MWKVLCLIVSSFAPTTKECLGVYDTYEEACNHCPEDAYLENKTDWQDIKYCVAKCKCM